MITRWALCVVFGGSFFVWNETLFEDSRLFFLDEDVVEVLNLEEECYFLDVIFYFLVYVLFWMNLILALWPPLTLRDFFIINLVIIYV